MSAQQSLKTSKSSSVTAKSGQRTVNPQGGQTNQIRQSRRMICAASLPAHFRKYFWDCPFEELSLEKYPRFIVARILNFGDWEAVSWLFARGGRELIAKAVKNGRYVNHKTENFWNMMLHG